MKDRASSHREPIDDREPPNLPAWKAFVLQLSRDSVAGGERLAGRLEHLSSGRRVRFDSPAGLVEALLQLLAEIEEPER